MPPTSHPVPIPPKARWLALSLLPLVLFGPYYVYDLPGATNRKLQNVWKGQEEGAESAWQLWFGSLYIAHFLPNIFMPFVSVWLIKLVGPRALLAVLVTVAWAGSAMFAFGVQHATFAAMIGGRLILGLAAELLGVAQAGLSRRWVHDDAGLVSTLEWNLFVARLASILNDVISPALAASPGATESSSAWVGSVTCMVSLLAGLVVFALDWSTFGREPESEDKPGEETTASSEPSTETVPPLPTQFYLLTASMLCLAGSTIPFINVASNYAYRHGTNDPVLAGALMAIPDVICVISRPMWASLLDSGSRGGTPFRHVGRALFASGVLIVAAHLCLSGPAPIIGLVLLGIGHSLCSKIWPLIALAVPKGRDVPGSFAIATALMNSSLALGSLLVACAAATDPSYTSTNIILSGLATAGALLGAALDLADINFVAPKPESEEHHQASVSLEEPVQGASASGDVLRRRTWGSRVSYEVYIPEAGMIRMDVGEDEGERGVSWSY
ncbi:major facilitator superfamily domain-containing protein [Blyttiomyces helicus]|uniref:Lysosomal dipeptide transporter MFSD1 n=1 Tax=Blyttiomyces helicus TaxID=388810 RepID=A0A4P9WD34_9FUNG|nr:major facilitator superfamily domain-containing protein [Blyttiomyces helicus]|eukprot:RKO88840.1 major facilitator superfamily domain-containing protein [Blyttiomyces helicus]